MAIIEMTTFRLADGIEEGHFIKADHAVQTEVFNGLPGFIRRTTARGADGEWLVTVLWGAPHDAEAVDPADPTVAAFARLIEERSLTTRRYETLD